MDLAALVRALGGAKKADSDAVVERAKPGSVGALAGLPPEQLAQLDRFTQGATTRREDGGLTAALTVPFAAGYEGVKGLAQAESLGSTGLPGGARALLEALGPEFGIDESTSPASLENVLAYLRGVAADPETLEPGFDPDEVRLNLPPSPARPNADLPPPPEVAAFLRSKR